MGMRQLYAILSLAFLWSGCFPAGYASTSSSQIGQRSCLDQAYYRETGSPGGSQEAKPKVSKAISCLAEEMKGDWNSTRSREVISANGFVVRHPSTIALWVRLNNGLANSKQCNILETAEHSSLGAVEGSKRRVGAASDHLILWVDARKLDAVAQSVAQLECVQHVSPAVAMDFANAAEASIVQGGGAQLNNSSRPAYEAGLTGGGEIIAVTDTGLRVRHCLFRDETAEFVGDGHRKVQSYREFGDRDVSGIHGSHISGSVAGHDIFSDDDSHDGIAKDAKIAFFDVGERNAKGDVSLTGVPHDINELFDPMRDDGAFVSSNSWGAPSPLYTEECRVMDDFLWDREDSLAVFAAGNSGRWGATTVGTPATAKNVLAVGASFSTNGSKIDKQAEARKAFDLALLDETLAAEVPPAALFQLDLGKEEPPMELTDASNEGAEIAFADPLTGCNGLRNGDAAAGKIVILDGYHSQEEEECSYEEKAQNAAKVGAKAILIVSDVCYPYPHDERGSAEIFTAAMTRNRLNDIWGVWNAGSKANFRAHIVPREADSEQPWQSGVPSFSAKGPSPAGRIKPDVAAPGTDISSADSETSCGFMNLSGTSDATPFAAGAASLIRQYMQSKGHLPSAALLKAIVVNGAYPARAFDIELMQSFASYKYNGLPIDAPPNCHHGWGIVDVARSLPLGGEESPSSMAFHDGAVLTQPRQRAVFRFRANASEQIRATLAWNDRPDEGTVHGTLTNDLDLLVKGSERGWTLPLGPSDRRNNIERVIVPLTENEEELELVVHANNVFGAQPFAVYVTGDVGPMGDPEITPANPPLPPPPPPNSSPGESDSGQEHSGKQSGGMSAATSTAIIVIVTVASLALGIVLGIVWVKKGVAKQVASLFSRKRHHQPQRLDENEEEGSELRSSQVL